MFTRDAMKALGHAFALSAVLNVLALGGSLYMMLVYDLVIPSGNGASLTGLALALVVVYAVQSVGDGIRVTIMKRIADESARDHMTTVGLLSRRHAYEGLDPRTDPARDMSALRAFIASPPAMAILDAPWTIVFVALLWALHPWLAVTTVVGMTVLAGIAYATHRTSAPLVASAERHLAVRTADDQERRAGARLARVMGMADDVDGRTRALVERVDQEQERIAARTARLASIGRTARTLLQSGILTVGALLVIHGDATGGVIFASSMVSGKALAPIDQLLAGWKSLETARISFHRLRRSLASEKPEERRLSLPDPHKTLDVADLVVERSGRRILDDVSFRLKAGDVLAIVGPSASGKTTLLEAIGGAIPSSDAVRIDGAALPQWDETQIGRHIGYLPQAVTLLGRTVGETISRLQPDPVDANIVKAAMTAGAHEMILSLPEGYSTRTDDPRTPSAGQRQRIALARALYGDPFLLLLDEPNSNLDTQGEAALARSVKEAADGGAVVVVAAHRSAILSVATHLLVLDAGRIRAFGPRDEVMKSIRSNA